ncbi:MAG: 30S ribosomal protein S12 methylthiotransferase RimO, partial [Atribacterota bacterium]
PGSKTSQGRTYGDAPDVDGTVMVRTGRQGIVHPGDIVPVRITRGQLYQLEGELL